MNNKCLIYCRVSSAKQHLKGSGIENQETSCKAYAKEHGFDIQKIYKDKGRSGGNTDREGLQEMLKFLKQEKEHYTVIVYDLTRLSREIGGYSKIRDDIYKYNHNITTVCNGTINNTPEDRFVSSIQVASGQYTREAGAKKSKTNMQNLAEQGYWVFHAPAGYIKKGTKHEKNYLIRKEPIATIIECALNKFATKELINQKEVGDYIKQEFLIHGLKAPANINDFTKRILTQELYCGFTSYPKWNIMHQKWKIDPLISVQTYKKIYDRLHNITRCTNPSYTIDNEDFPLRGQILCPCCGKPITGSYTKSGRFAYYYCGRKACKGKVDVNVKPEILHKDFNDLLENIAFDHKFLPNVSTIIKNTYSSFIAKIKQKQHTDLILLSQIKSQIEITTNAYISECNKEIKDMLRENLSSLLSQKTELENTQQTSIQISNIKEAFELAYKFITDIPEIWKKEDVQFRKQLCSLIFSKKPTYSKINKFYDYELSEYFTIISHFHKLLLNWVKNGSKQSMVLDLQKNNEIADPNLENSRTNSEVLISGDFQSKGTNNTCLVP